MNIPNLPTDNLYKFLALFGLVLFLFCNIYPTTKLNKVEEEVIKIKTEIGEIDLEIDFLEEEIDKYEEDIEEAEMTISEYQFSDTTASKINAENLARNLQSKDYRDYLEFIYKYKDDIFPVHKLQREIQAKREKINQKRNKIKLRLYRSMREREIVSQKNSDIIKLAWGWAIGSSIGFTMMFFGFRLWYKKVQKPIDEKMVAEIKSLENNKPDDKT